MFTDDRGEARRWTLGVLFGISGFLSQVSAAEVAPDVRELLDRYRRAATSWDKSVSMRVECDHSLVYRGRDFRHWKYDITHRRDGDRCEWFGHCQFEGKHEGSAYSFNEEFRDVVSEDYVLHYSHSSSPGECEAFMRTNVTETLLTLQTRPADGGFLQGRTGGIGSATHLAEAMCDSNEPRYVGQETLDGLLCHIVETKTKYGTFTVWLAPEREYNALKYVLRKSGRDIQYNNVRAEDLNIIEWTETVDAIDVQKIGPVFVPVCGRLREITRYAGGEEDEEHTTARRREIVPNPDFKALGAFQIVLPEGTEVRLVGNSRRIFRWSNGEFTPDITKYLVRSLRGKPLPGWDGIRMDVSPAGAEGKALVVCFFDMQQRPSRNCMVQLAQKAELLAKKGIVVLGIQIGGMEEEKLREWRLENGVCIPVGTVQADEEQTRCAWGVQSLPWLILTDKSHTVAAEGFTLDALEAKVENLVGGN